MRRRPRSCLALLAALALAGGCRPAPRAPSRPDPAGPASAAAPAPATRPPADAAPVEPDVCHASVDWRAGGFEIVGLPCVRRDGAELLFARSGDRPGQPALTVVAVTRDDQLARHAVVMEPHERGELLDAAQRPTPELRQRIVKANVLLAEASRGAVPLAPFAATPAGTHAGQGLEIAWTAHGRLTISRGGRFVHEGDHARWLDACAAGADLARVWGDAARGVLLVELAPRGGAGCAAAPALHAIGWTP